MSRKQQPTGGGITLSEEHGIRFLHFSSAWVQGAMRIARPWALELDYTREMMCCLLMRQGVWPRSVLQIGLGAASLTKFLYRHRPQCRQTIVEINPQVVDIARQYFRLMDDPERIDIEIGDGVEFVAESNRQFDLILVDGFDAEAKAGALNTTPFYELCRGRLSERGILVANLLRRNRATRLGVERVLTAFSNRVLALPATEDGNTVVFAVAGNIVSISATTLLQRAAALKLETGLDLGPALARLRERDGATGIVI